jgi:hypothetical protein
VERARAHPSVSAATAAARALATHLADSSVTDDDTLDRLHLD